VPANSDGLGDGFDATARMVAYGTGCYSYTTEPDAGDNGMVACAMLRVLDVQTGRVASFAAPAGTAGWLPAGFSRVSAFSPSGQMIAAYAAVPPAEEGRDRLYLVRLGTGRLTPVPSAARTFADTAWSEDGSWLLYQGAGQHLWTYQVTSGKVSSSSTPCCNYAVMVASRSS
jgi:Tol biopolymer transport system component